LGDGLARSNHLVLLYGLRPLLLLLLLYNRLFLLDYFFYLIFIIFFVITPIRDTLKHILPLKALNLVVHLSDVRRFILCDLRLHKLVSGHLDACLRLGFLILLDWLVVFLCKVPDFNIIINCFVLDVLNFILRFRVRRRIEVLLHRGCFLLLTF
jgi:hypothetical protein